MVDLETLEAGTMQSIAAGVRQLQAFLIAESETDHAARLLDLMDPPLGAVIMDAGCGIGETARLMRSIRPDLTFLLVNLSNYQLDLCPEDIEQYCCSYDKTLIDDASVDVVMYSYSLCQSEDWAVTLAEARRVLKPDGKVFIHDIADVGGADAALWQQAGAKIRTLDEVARLVRHAGFSVDDVYLLEPKVNQLAKLGAVGMEVGVQPYALTSRPIADPIAQAFARHDRVGFQFSGGRDSTAALYLLREWWPHMTVYHLDTGDQFPETRAVVAAVERDLLQAGGRLERICTNVAADRAQFGMPSDLIPVDNQASIGQGVSGRKVRIQGRYDCCYRSLMWPMHQRIQGDGVTLLIRGQRDDEYAAPPVRDGQTDGGIEFMYPVQSWASEDVDRYIRDNGLPVAPWYAYGAPHGSDCMGCTAWWDDGRSAYMKQAHPEKYAELRKNLAVIRGEINRQVFWLNEMEA